MLRFLPALISVLAVATSSLAQNFPRQPTLGEREFLKLLGREAPIVPLWPSERGPDEPKPPKEERFLPKADPNNPSQTAKITDVEAPSFVVISPKENQPQTGAAILLCPGGGYGVLGLTPVLETTKWMNARGITVVLLKYRVPKRHNGYGFNHQPLQDAQRALGILRSRAREWKLDSDKIGVAGFSAGGHLAASLSINDDKRWYPPIDPFDAVSCRPDFALLLYPAYLTDPIESRQRDAKLHYEKISAQSTPPTLLAITRPDKFTHGCIEYSAALREAKVPYELHIYPEGRHGGAIEKMPFGDWANQALRFLHDQGILEKTSPPQPHQYAGAATIAALPSSGDLPLGDSAIRTLLGQQNETVFLWPNDENRGPNETLQPAPETVTGKSRGGTAVNITRVTQPTLTILPPTKKTDLSGRAVIVCPGGAYRGLAAEHEGTRVCQWLSELGITAVLLKYRVPRREGEFPKHHHALQDLQRAIRIVRSRAEEWGIDSNKIGICGFSAGGHLCTTLANQYQIPSYPSVDGIDETSAAPDFALLIYPAYLEEVEDTLDPLIASPKGGIVPPLFLAIANDDRFTPGVLNYFPVLQKANLSAELHIYERGGHGGGMDPSSYPTSLWTNDAERWLRELD